jgi:hypothetical protein
VCGSGGGVRIGVEEMGDDDGKSPAAHPWAAGHSVCPGVTTSGIQLGSGVVNGLPVGAGIVIAV